MPEPIDAARIKVIDILKSIEDINNPDISPLITYLDTLQEIDLSIAYLSVKDIQNLSEALKKNTTLTRLNLAHNNINTHIRYLAEALKVNNTLTALNLYGNEIDQEAIKGLANVLKINTSLMNLDLRANNLKGVGVSRLGNTICNITHRDMEYFVLQAENNGLTNLSDFDEKAYWVKIFASQKKRFDEQPKPEAVIEIRTQTQRPERPVSFRAVLWKYRVYVVVGAAAATAMVAGAGLYMANQSKPSGRS